MDYASFKKKYNGTKQDFDKAAGVQCVDLAKMWAELGWKMKWGSVGGDGGARNIMNRNSIVSDTLVDRVKYKAGNIPPQGAIIVFNAAKGNKWGHVAIVESADSKGITVLEQNALNRGDAIRVSPKPYKYGSNGTGVGEVLGWVVPKFVAVGGVSDGNSVPSKKYYV